MSATRASNDRPPGAGGVKRGRLQQETATTGSRVTVVLGAQWGDEGKGKVVDLLATDADIISRCQVRQGGPPPRQTQPPPPVLPPRLRHASWSLYLRGHLPSSHPHPLQHPLRRSHFPLCARHPSPTPAPRNPSSPQPQPPPLQWARAEL